MKILALGATGAIGSEMIAALDPGHQLFVTTRRARDRHGAVRYIKGNALDDGFLREVLEERWDAVVDFMLYDYQAFTKRIDVLLGATDQYIFVSTGRVFANSSGPLTERSPRLLDLPRNTELLGDDDYAITKARQENLLRESGGRNWTIVRPYITFNKARLQLGSLEKEAWLYRALKGRAIVFCDELLDKQTTMTDGRDVARMIAALIGAPAALGEDYNLAGGQAVTWREVLALYMDALRSFLGRPPRVVLQDLESFARSTRTLPQITFDRMYDRRFDPTKIGSLFDVRSLSDTLPALRRRVEAQLADGAFDLPDWSMEARRDKAAYERSSLREMPSARTRLAYLSHRYLPDRAISMLRSR